MPTFNIIKNINSDLSTFRAQNVIGMFDLQVNNLSEIFTGEIPIENIDWNIGIIFGASGTGKTTIAKELFGDFENFKYSNTSIINDMPKEKSFKDIIKMFNSVGFSSPPSWLKPYDVLSNGEKMRVDLARELLAEKEIVIFDEFTSVVNREVAKISSYAVSKAIRKNNKKFIAVSCHDDIIDWLEPDWIFNTNNMKFELVKKKDHPLNATYTDASQTYGNFLKSITI